MKTKLFSFAFVITCLLVFFSFGCKKKAAAPEPIQYGTVTDADNNTYRTVKIGNQWWMAENLRTTKYRNGWPIKQVTSSDNDTVWSKATKAFYCSYSYAPSPPTRYGLLYNWYVITDTNIIAPAGWHIPSDDEWKQLEKTLGMSQADADKVNWRGDHEADKLKVASPEDWASYSSVWSTNESGFSAYGGCCRLFNGQWGNPGTTNTGFWWSSTTHTGDNKAWYRYLDYKNSNVFRYYGYKTYGMSIRCVKD